MGEKSAQESVATLFGFTTGDLNLIRLHENALKSKANMQATIDTVAKSLFESYIALDADGKSRYISEGAKTLVQAERFGFDKSTAYVTALAKLDAEFARAFGTALKKARAEAKKAGANTPLGPNDTDDPNLIAFALDREENARADRDLQRAIEENAESTVNLWNILQERGPEEREQSLAQWTESLVRDKALKSSWMEKIAAIKRINPELGGILEKRVKKALNEQKRKWN